MVINHDERVVTKSDRVCKSLSFLRGEEGIRVLDGGT